MVFIFEGGRRRQLFDESKVRAISLPIEFLLAVSSWSMIDVRRSPLGQSKIHGKIAREVRSTHFFLGLLSRDDFGLSQRVVRASEWIRSSIYLSHYHNYLDPAAITNKEKPIRYRYTTMPKLVGKSTRVVTTDSLGIDELVGNVASNEDTISVARVVVSAPTSEPWLTLDYDEWLCVLKGRVEIHYGDNKVLHVEAGQTCFVEKGERFKPVFPVGDTEYIPICLPAFKPERCKREEEDDSAVSVRLQELHSGGISNGPSVITDDAEQLYHMCEKTVWHKATADSEAYFPPTFEKDGYFTHATAVPMRLVETANHFYTASTDEWICIELSNAALKRIGIVTRFEEPKPVGETGVGTTWSEWRCPHIFGGIPAQAPGVVTKIYPMKRDEKGEFLSIQGLTDV